MRELFEQYKRYIIIGGVVVVIIAVYVLFFSGDGDEAALVSETPTQGESASGDVGRDLLEQLLQLRSITLEEAVFDDPIFNNLVDFGRELQPQPVGRDNPFEPLSGATPEGGSAGGEGANE